MLSTLFAVLRAHAPTPGLIEIALAFSPRVRRHGDRAVVLDVSGLERLLGGPDVIAAELARAAAERGVAPHVAVAPTQTAALLLTLDHGGPSVVTADPAPVLAPLPIRRLQQFVEEEAGLDAQRTGRWTAAQGGDGEPVTRAFDMVRRWGLRTLGDLAALPAADLVARMGQDGVRLQRLARGEETGPFVPDPDMPRFLERMELEWPVDTLEPLSFVLARLLEPLAVRLERADRGAVAVRLDLRLVDRRTHARVLSLPSPMRDARVLRTLLLLDLESHPAPAAIDVVTIEIDPAPGRVLQYSLLERALPSAETLATLTARLHALVGDTRCGTPVPVDTHRPDGFEMSAFAPATARLTPAVAGATARLTPAVAGATAGLSPALRRFRPPVAVRVRVEGGRPVALAIDRRGMPGGTIVQAAGPWRTSGQWWRPDDTGWNRDEWDVALTDGSLCRLYRDRPDGTWFLEGVFD